MSTELSSSSFPDNLSKSQADVSRFVLELPKMGGACRLIAGEFPLWWRDLMPSGEWDAKKISSLVLETFSTGQWPVCLGGEFEGGGDFHLKLRDEGNGSTLWRLSVVPADSGKSLLCFSRLEFSCDVLKESTVWNAWLGVSDTSGVCYYVRDEESSRVLFVSSGVEKIFQVKSDIIYQRSDAWMDTVLAPDRERVQKERARLLKEGTGEIKFRIQRPDGTVRLLQSRSVRARVAGRNIMISSVIDVTDHIDLEERVEGLLQGIEQSQDGFALTDAQGCFIYMNRAHLDMFGFGDISEVLGQTWRILYEETEATRIEREVMPVLFAQKVWRGECVGRKRNGTTFVEDFTLSALPDGRIACNCRDVTRDYAIRRQLENNEQMFRDFVSHVPSGISIHDTDGTCRFINQRAASLLERSDETMIGVKTEDYFPSDVAEPLRICREEVLKNKDTASQLLKFDHASGERVVQVVMFPMFRDGGIHRICTVTDDVTEKHRLEEETRQALVRQRELLGMQREFVSMVSHEFRTPMASIQGTIYLIRKLLEDHPDEKIGRYLKLQQEAMGTLRELVDQVLLLNRIEHTIGEPELVDKDLIAIVVQIIGRINETLPQTRIKLVMQPDLSCVIPLDESLIRAALDNLLSNALKYSRQIPR